MNRYMIVSRLRWPALLLLTGVIALLDQMDILTWGHAWPLYLILLGVLALAERAALASEPMPPPPGYPPYAAGYQAAGYAPQAGSYPATPEPPAPAAQPASTGIVPVQTDLEVHSDESPRKSWEQEEER
jgi:hypothetical protein